MVTFAVDMWDGVIHPKSCVEVDPAAYKDWGNPLEICYAVLATARWGKNVQMPGEMRMRVRDKVTIAGDGGVYEGTAYGRPFRIRNLAMMPSNTAKDLSEESFLEYCREALQAAPMPQLAGQAAPVLAGQYNALGGAGQYNVFAAPAGAMHWVQYNMPEPQLVVAAVEEDNDD